MAKSPIEPNSERTQPGGSAIPVSAHAPTTAPATLTTEQRLGDAPIEAEYHDLMNYIAKVLDESFNGTDRSKPRSTGFILLVFPFNNHEGRCNYISNGADRRDVCTMFREQIKRFEGSPDQTGRA